MDVSLATFVVLLHVATAFVFVGGLIGRWIVLGRVRRSDDLADARQRGTTTAELSAAFRDPWVAFARTYEVVIVGVVVALMVLKPF